MTSRATQTDCEWTQCDSCSDTWFNEHGDTTHEKPHRSEINSESGVCADCLRELKARGFSDEQIFGQTILSGGRADGDASSAKWVGSSFVGGKPVEGCSGNDTATDRDNSESLHPADLPVQFRPAAQINYYGKAA